MFLNKQHLTIKLREGSIAQRKNLAVRLAHLIQQRWPDENVTGYLGADRVLAMADMFVGRANTLKDIVDELTLLFDQPDWSSEEAQEMLSMVGPLEYGEYGCKDSVASFFLLAFADVKIILMLRASDMENPRLSIFDSWQRRRETTLLGSCAKRPIGTRRKGQKRQGRREENRKRKDRVDEAASIGSVW